MAINWKRDIYICGRIMQVQPLSNGIWYFCSNFTTAVIVISYIKGGQHNWSKKRCYEIYNFWTTLCLGAKFLFTDKVMLSTWCLSDEECDIVLPRNLTGLSGIDGIKQLFFFLFFLTIIDYSFSFETFPFSNTRFLDLEGFTDIRAHDWAADAPSKRVLVCWGEGDIRKRSSINALMCGERETGN